MKKILIISQDNFDARYSRARLSNWLYNERNVQCDILCPKGVSFHLEGGNVYHFEKRGISLKNIGVIKQVTNENNYDTVFFRAVENIFMGFLSGNNNTNSIYLITGLGRMFTGTGHFMNFIRKFYGFVLRMFSRIQKTSFIFQNHEDPADLGIKNYFLMNGSGFPLIKDASAYQNNKTKITFLTATRLTKKKGLDDIIQLCDLVKNNSKFHYYICGDMTHLDTYYQNRIQDLNQFENIEFTGFVENLEPYFTTTDFSYYPTKYREGAPRFLIDCLRYGVIPFTNSMPGCPDLVSLNNGFLDLNHHEILDKAFEIHSKPETLISMKKNCLKLFEDNYEENKVYNTLANFILK